MNIHYNPLLKLKNSISLKFTRLNHCILSFSACSALVLPSGGVRNSGPQPAKIHEVILQEISYG